MSQDPRPRASGGPPFMTPKLRSGSACETSGVENVMTAEGLQALKDELEQLETVGRREIAQQIKTAREWGDLKENAEYHAAKDAQAHLETRIKLLREQLM